jgi:signal transduction histidine kinase
MAAGLYTQVVNALAHFGAALIFGIFLILLVKDRASARVGANWLSLAAAWLAFAWNLGSLVALIVPSRSASPTAALVALNFCALSLLPAVLLHLCLWESGMRSLIATGYLTSTLAVGLHLLELLRPDLALHQIALTAVTVGFAILTALSVYLFLRMDVRTDRPRMARILGSMCLALLAISVAHFGSEHLLQPWSKELVLHHASLPLALLILLQDDRFILLDAFVRFLANVLLAGVMTLVVLKSAASLFPGNTPLPGSALQQAVLFASIALLLILFAFLRGTFQRWLTKAVFRRGDLEKAIREIRNLQRNGEADFVVAGAERTAAFVGARRCEVIADGPLFESLLAREVYYPVPTTELHRLPASIPGWINAVVPLRMLPGDTRYLLLGRRKGGRRYLSEDLVALSHLMAVIVDEVGRFRNAEMRRLVSSAELRALQSQINPHFLFNALNTLYGIIPREATGARRTVLNLSEIFRYFLRVDRTYIPLSEELKIVAAYLEIEHLRLGPRLETQIDVDDAVLSVPVPALSIQPLVENSIKHGLSAKPEGGRLTVAAKALNGQLRISVKDTGLGMSGRPGANSGEGVGIMNVTRRLQLCYGPQCGLTIRSGESGTHVEFAVPLA